MRDTNTDGSGLLYRLSTPERVDHSTTLAAITLTFLLSFATVELNPVAARLFDAIGYPATAAVAMLAVGLAFDLIRRYESEYPRGTLVWGWSLASVGIVDVAINSWRLAVVGLPETTRVDVLSWIVAGGAAGVAVLELVRRRDRVIRIGRSLEVPKPDAKPLITALIVVVLVVSPISGMIGFPVSDSALAANYSESWEDGNAAGWTLSASGGHSISVQNQTAFDGSYALEMYHDDGSSTQAANPTASRGDWNWRAADRLNVQFMLPGASSKIKVRLTSHHAVRVENGEMHITEDNYDKWSDTSFSGTQGEWLKMQVTGNGAGNITAVLTNASSGNKLAEITATGVGDGTEIVLSAGGDGDNSATSYFDKIEYKENYSATSPVSGTVTDKDGVAIGSATVEAYQNGALQATTTTDSSGKYSLSLGDGDYTIEAKKSGYLTEQTSVTVSGSAVSGVDLSLAENAVSGTVISQSGDPVAGQTVQVFGMNYSHPDIETASDPQQTAREALSSYAEAVPSTWNQTLDPKSDIFSSTDGNYAAVTTAEVDSDSWFSTSDLGDPQIKVPADEMLYFTEWDPTRTGGITGYQGEWDSQLPGAAVDDGRIVVEQISAGGDVQSSTVLGTAKTQSAGGFGPLQDPSTIDYAATSLNPGFYRVYPKGNPASAYVIQVGSLQESATASTSKLITPELKNNSGQLAESAQAEAQALANNKMVRKTAVTGSDGNFSIQLPNNIKTVSVQVIGSHPGETVSSTGETELPPIPKNREAAKSVQNWSSPSEENLTSSTFVVSTGPEIVDVPSSGVRIEVVELSTPGFTNVSNQVNKSKWREALLSNLSYADLPPQLLENISSLRNKTRLNNLSKVDRKRLKELYGQLENLSQANSNLEDRVKKLLQERNATTSPDSVNESINLYVNASKATNAELVERIAALEGALSQLESTIDTGDGETDVSGETVSWIQTFDADLSPDNVLVRAHYTNGSIRTLSPESPYVSVNSRPGLDDEVRITQLPLGEAAGAALSIDVATDDGTGTAKEVVKNPTYSGQMPEINAISLSTLRPGPRETVTATLRPASTAPALELERVSVRGPDGTTVPATINDTRTLQFTTHGSGSYAVRMVFSTPNGKNHTLRQYIEAGNSSVEMAPGIRVRTTPFGPTAIVGDGLRGGEVTYSQGGTVVDVVATIPSEAEAPDTVDVFLSSLSIPPTATVSVRIAKGEVQQSIGQHIETRIHLSGLSEETLLYRNGEPLSDDSKVAKIMRGAGSATISTHTDDQATLELRRNANPTFLERWGFKLATFAPDLSLPIQLGGFGGVGAASAGLGLAPIAGLLVAGKRRRSQ